MKISITTKECKSKSEDAPRKGCLCFRLRDKGVDLKVRSEIEVMLDCWDNDNLSYKRTRQISADEQKRIKDLVRSIIATLTDEYDADIADVTWTKRVIDRCVNPPAESKEGLTTVVSRMEQYIDEHPMSPRSALVYKSCTTSALSDIGA